MEQGPLACITQAPVMMEKHTLESHIVIIPQLTDKYIIKKWSYSRAWTSQVKYICLFVTREIHEV